jgi:hypothetical protein
MEGRNCTECDAEIQAYAANRGMYLEDAEDTSYLQDPGDTSYLGERKCPKCLKAVLEFDERSGLTILVNPLRDRRKVPETWFTT